MAKIRVGRVQEQIKKELFQILQTEWKDPRVGFITITAVEVTGDLSLARVFVSVMGDDQQKEDTLSSLSRGKGFIRSELGKRIRLRVVPEIEFKMDESIDYGARIEKLLSDLNEGKSDE